MKAIRFDHYGEPVKVLAIEERPVPKPVDGEVRFVFSRARSTHLTCCMCGNAMRVSKRSFQERCRRFVPVRIRTGPPKFSRSSSLLQTSCKR